MKESHIILTWGELNTLTNILSKYVRLLGEDLKFSSRYTTSEIFEIRQTYRKLVYSNSSQSIERTKQNHG